MRVITGSARGRKLKTLEGLDVRPTTDMVKEAVFTIIQFRVPYASMLDLFAGCGQMGIEALSRGASRVVFVDRSRESQAVIKENLTATGLMKQSRVIADDVVSFLSHASDKYDIIFLDPPYDEGYGPKILPLLEKALAPGGIVLFEHRYKEEFPETAGGLVRKKNYKYGKIAVTTYVHAEDAQ